MTKPLLDTLRDIQAFEQMPLHERFPAGSALELIEQSAQQYGDEPALDFLLTGRRDEIPQTLSFHDLARATRQTANLLSELGLSSDESVSLLLPILPQSHPLILGCQTAGIVNPVNPLLEPEHIADIMQASGARIIACLAPSKHNDLWQKLQLVLPLLPSVHTVLAVHQTGLTDQEAPLDIPGSQVKVIDYNEALAGQPGNVLTTPRQIKTGTIAAHFHTGGTTGRPKIAQLTHGNIAFLGQLARPLSVHLGRQTLMCGLPLFHIFGVIILGIGAFSAGNRVVLLTPAGFRNPEVIKNLWHHVARFRANGFSAVPTVLTALAQIPTGDEDISSLNRISSGAAPLSPAFAKRFKQTYGVNVTNGYGMTESTSLISRAPDQQPPGSVGLRLPYARVRIAQLDGNQVMQECATGESGVILVKGPQIFAGYKSSTDNDEAWVEDTWFNTGDLGYLDDDGFLYLTGRAKDLIIRSGHNIDPELIEEPLNRHPDLISAVAVGMPDPYAGELPVAFVVCKPGTHVSAQQLLKYCEQEIPERAAVPKRIEIIDALPITAVGKIFRPALRERITVVALENHLQSENIRATVSAHTDARKGLTASIQLENPLQRKQAEALLSTYPIGYTIES